MQPTSEPDSDPLHYLSPIERLLVGWSVTRQFKTNTPRFAKQLERSGPHALARIGCAQTFSMYIWLFVLPGVAFQAAGLAKVAVVLYVLAGIAASWAVVCVVSAIKPQRRYRHSRHTGERGAG